MKKYCIKCQKEVGSDIVQCTCQNRSFVVGDVKPIKKNFACECGETKFRTVSHLELSYKAINNYVCSQCGNSVIVEHYRNKNDVLFK